MHEINSISKIIVKDIVVNLSAIGNAFNPNPHCFIAIIKATACG
jgi:hypothetical protein